MYFHGFRVKVAKGDNAVYFTPDNAYRVLAVNDEKPAAALLLLRDDKGDLCWVGIRDVKVHSIDVPR